MSTSARLIHEIKVNNMKVCPMYAAVNIFDMLASYLIIPDVMVW